MNKIYKYRETPSSRMCHPAVSSIRIFKSAHIIHQETLSSITLSHPNNSQQNYKDNLRDD